MLNKKELKILTLTCILIIALFGGVYIISTKKAVFVLKKFEKEYTPLGVEIPSKVYAYNGVVEEIGDEYMVISSSSENNYITQDQPLRIRFDGSTKFERYVLPSGIPKDARTADPKREKIGSFNISKGDTVEVWSKKNIRGKIEFSANVIKLIEF